MAREIELWQFAVDRLRAGERLALLIVAESHGSSPGRAGYKLAVSDNGELLGSIGGGVMEVNLVEKARAALTTSLETSAPAELIVQEHKARSENASGMICSGGQTVIITYFGPADLPVLEATLNAYSSRYLLLVSRSSFASGPDFCGTRYESGDHRPIRFELHGDGDFVYSEVLNARPTLYIVGGGHCALALSELMSRLDFRVEIFDDRPDLNTIEKNDFADEVTIVGSYREIGGHIRDSDAYVVVMTLGYRTDSIVVRSLLDRDLKYFGVLGSRAKMATLMRELKEEGLDPERLARIRTPIGLPINSRTPEEIAVSIAAEIISVKNAD